jgi:imidazoleglycerol phosphate synthase glutamine amidotransferase subunit HisH
LERIRAGVPFLGICLGLQALFEPAKKRPEVRGLGLFPGTVRRFRAECACRTWAGMNWSAGSKLVRGSAGQAVRVFRPQLLRSGGRAGAAAICTYAAPYTAALEADNVFGVQFHPEKSGPVGLRIVQNPVEI